MAIYYTDREEDKRQAFQTTVSTETKNKGVNVVLVWHTWVPIRCRLIVYQTILVICKLLIQVYIAM